MDEPFYYLSAEDRVPRDAVHVVIGGAITVVEPRAFESYLNLARVEFREGVEAIGRRAFLNCRNSTGVDSSSLRGIGAGAFAFCARLSEAVPREGLEQIGHGAFYDCASLERIAVPSSVVTIGNGAFAECRRLSEANLTEGLRRIGTRAFFECALLERIAVPSSVVTIGNEAFSGCRRLSEVNLKEGLQGIRTRAFKSCALERITVPSSVAKIRREAFAECERLSEVTLAGGMVMLARGTFVRCPRLERITISSTAIVVQAGEDGNGRVAAVTGGIERDPSNESPQLILASPHLASMRPEELRDTTESIDRFADATRGAGALNLADGGVSDRIRDCFVDHLSTWYGGYKREVATILELGLWKIELGRTREASRSRAAGGRKRARADVPTPDDSRRTCGADPIVGLVLSSLAGPHRRAAQVENAGSIQP